MKKRAKKPRNTAYKRAAEKPEVKKLIKSLKDSWNDLSRDERTIRLQDLHGEDCSIRGLAAALGKSESALRCYLPPSPKGAKAAPQPAAASSPAQELAPGKEARRTAVERKQDPSPLKSESEENRRNPELFQNRVLRKLPPRPQAKALGEREDAIASLRMRLPQVIVDFIRAKVGDSAEAFKIQELLQSLRTHLRVQLDWIHPKQLPDPVTFTQLLEITKPKLGEKELSPSDLGKWLTITLLSLNPNVSFLEIIDDAERQLLPSPVDESTPETQPLRTGSSLRIAVPEFWRRGRLR